MKKRFMAVLIALVMCLAAFSGCSAMKGLERDVQVILQNEGAYVGTYTVNIFNNAVVPEMEKEGFQFRGWSVKDNWTEGMDSEELLSENTGLIRYDDIKDYIGKDSLSITLYAAYSEIPQRDLVIAWYNKETTSGLTQESIDAFQTELYAYLTTQGYTPEQMDIVIRGYSGDVGTTCSEIKKDGDVDIMIGWSSTSNITGTGGMEEGTDFIENNGGVTIGAKERYAARLTDTELCNLVYRWIFDKYSETGLPDEPEPQPDADLVIAWYDRHTDSTDSGLTQEIMGSFVAALRQYLSTQGYNGAEMNIVTRAYSGAVGDSCGQIKEVGDVDIMVGWSSNIDTTGGMTEGVDYLQNVGGVSIGTAERYAARLTNDELTRLVYRWIFDTYSETPLPDYTDDPTTDPEPDQPDLSDRSLKIAWYDKESTSGLNALIIANFENALKGYLAESGYPMAEMNIELRGYEGDVATSCEAIRQDGDIDIMIGWSSTSNLTGTGGMTEGTDFLENVSGIPMGGKTRYIARVTDTAITKLVFAWLQTQSAQDSLVSVEITDTNLVIGWYAKTSTTGLTEEMLTAFETSLTAYLAQLGLTDTVTLEIRAYSADLDVAGVGTQVNGEGDVDILLGMGANITTTGKIETFERVDYTMGGKGRNIARLTDDDLTKIIFAWMQTDAVRALFA